VRAADERCPAFAGWRDDYDQFFSAGRTLHVDGGQKPVCAEESTVNQASKSAAKGAEHLSGKLMDIASAKRLLVDELTLVSKDRWQQACQEAEFPENLVAILERLRQDSGNLPTAVSLGLTSHQIDEILAGRARQLVFGPRVILERLGEGGTAEVFVARHSRHLRLEALKVEKSQGPSNLRGQWEAVLTAKLQHPCLPVLHDAGEVEGRAYLAMELLSGKDLEKYLRDIKAGDQRIPVLTVVNWMLQIVDCLRYLHSRGVIHQDVKPANVILTDSGAVKLVDFGMARGNSQVWGPLALAAWSAAPSIPIASQPEPGPAEDYFRLGCGMFRLLTGEWPLSNQGEMELANRGAGSRRARAAARTDLPPLVSAILRKLLDKNPAGRYHDGLDLQRDLARARRGLLSAGDPVAAPQVSSGPRVWRGLEKLVFERHVRHSKIELPTRLDSTILPAARGVRRDELQKVVDIALDASPYHSMREQLPAIFARWLDADPHIFEFVALSPDDQDKEQGERSPEPIGYTCILPLTEDRPERPGSFSLYLDGKLSEWAIGPEHLAPSDLSPVRSLCVQSATLTHKTWKQLHEGRKWQPAAARELLRTIVRHVLHFNWQPFSEGSSLRLVADGNLRGIALLESHGFRSRNRASADGRALYELDFSWRDSAEVNARTRNMIRRFEYLLSRVSPADEV
jgi:serine/threonine protein kinase